MSSARRFNLPDAAPRGNGAGEQSKKVTKPRAGTVLQREWRGQQIRVGVLRDGGFSWNGDRYGSRSAVARAVTGSRWNGRLFFGLTGRAKA